MSKAASGGHMVARHGRLFARRKVLALKKSRQVGGLLPAKVHCKRLRSSAVPIGSMQRRESAKLPMTIHVPFIGMVLTCLSNTLRVGMAAYRCTSLDGALQVRGVECFECEHDVEALIRTINVLGDLTRYQFAEVWCGPPEANPLMRPRGRYC